MRKLGIENQALMVALIPVLIFALFLESYFIHSRIGEMDRAVFDRANLIVHQLASSSEYAVFSGNLGLLQQQVDVAISQPDVNAVVVLDAAGNYLVRDGNAIDYSNVPMSAGPIWLYVRNGKMVGGWLYNTPFLLRRYSWTIPQRARQSR